MDIFDSLLPTLEMEIINVTKKISYRKTSNILCLVSQAFFMLLAPFSNPLSPCTTERSRENFDLLKWILDVTPKLIIRESVR